MTKKLKLWSGRGDYRTYDHFYVAAYSRKHAAELISRFSHLPTTTYEIKTYYSPRWGNSMNNIEPEVGLWAQKIGEKEIKRLI